MKVFIFLVLIRCIAETLPLYSECPGKNFGDSDTTVRVSGCEESYCRLKKKSKTTVEFNFKPTKDVPQVHNAITAIISGLYIPWLGVDGADAKGNIFEEGGQKKAEFPLKANVVYLYKREVNILPVYPTLSTVVHWALTGPDGDLMCFEVPARITK